MTASLIHADFIRTHPAQAVLTLLGLSGVVLVFLPFTGGGPLESFLESLVVDTLEDLFMLAVVGPFVVLPFFISAGYLRWVLTAGLSRGEIWLGYALSLMVVVLLSLSIIQEWWAYGFGGWFSNVVWPIFAFLVLGLGAGAWFVIQNLRHGIPLTLMALVAMQLAYLPFALGWLTVGPVNDLMKGWREVSDIYIGAYLAFLTVLIYTAQAVLSVRGQPRLTLRLLPLGLIWAPWVAGSALAWLR